MFYQSMQSIENGDQAREFDKKKITRCRLLKESYEIRMNGWYMPYMGTKKGYRFSYTLCQELISLMLYFSFTSITFALETGR